MTNSNNRNDEAQTPAKVVLRAVDLINSQNTMTLATSAGESTWAAPVYYVYEHCAFYFFSDPESRHIREGLPARESSAAIHAPSTGWRDIRGIQMSGRIERIPLGREAASAFGAYLKKYPFCKEFFSPGSVLNLETSAADSRPNCISLFRSGCIIRTMAFNSAIVNWLIYPIVIMGASELQSE